ncbi:MAG: NAD(P)H-dependent oxidoreductase, partial [Actinomycetia bacterium]|nr:NAD(P)H-dependent oxidoreductase [Actinomycetes bacterium]
MNVLWVFAHPEPRSLSGALRDEGARALTEAGHAVRMSDLYAMGWKATVDVDDFGHHEPDERLRVSGQSKCAHQEGVLRDDIRAEQDKLDWADAVVVQFP